MDRGNLTSNYKSVEDLFNDMLDKNIALQINTLEQLDTYLEAMRPFAHIAEWTKVFFDKSVATFPIFVDISAGYSIGDIPFVDRGNPIWYESHRYKFIDYNDVSSVLEGWAGEKIEQSECDISTLI